MRLNKFNPANIRVRNRSGGGGGLPLGGGKLGIGTIVIALIAMFVFGVDPSQMLGSLENVQQGTSGQQAQTGSQNTQEICEQNAYALESCNALSSLNETWSEILTPAGIPLTQPVLNFYQGNTTSGCGAAQSAMGPFYCPADHGIYIDTSFYDQLARQLGAQGDFARYYVMAHEYGHHIQNLAGLADQVHSVQSRYPTRANELQIRLELQADCYAGVWAGRNRELIEPGDMQEGMQAASAIGDDTLQRNAGQQINPESFTHGTSAQRMQWLRKGLETGNEDACDSFSDLRG